MFLSYNGLSELLVLPSSRTPSSLRFAFLLQTRLVLSAWNCEPEWHQCVVGCWQLDDRVAFWRSEVCHQGCAESLYIRAGTWPVHLYDWTSHRVISESKCDNMVTKRPIQHSDSKSCVPLWVPGDPWSVAYLPTNIFSWDDQLNKLFVPILADDGVGVMQEMEKHFPNLQHPDQHVVYRYIDMQFFTP